jgi:hypothetical protein
MMAGAGMPAYRVKAWGCEPPPTGNYGSEAQP